MNHTTHPTTAASVNLGLPKLAVANLMHSWRISLAVVLGVATATAVIVGALLVGDSMRGSLRELTLDRLGRIESIVAPGSFFDPSDVTAAHVYPVVLFSNASVEATRQNAALRRASNIQVIGVDEQFWELDSSGNIPKQLPQGDHVVLNESLAYELGVVVGDQVTLRLPVEQAVPADSPLGRRDTQTEGLPRLEVVDIIPDRGLGRFSLAPNQAAPQIIFADRDTLVDALDRVGQVNVLMSDEVLDDSNLHPDLGQLGVKLERVTQTFQADDQTEPITIFDYYSVTSDQLLVPQPAVRKIVDSFPSSTVTMTYLANAIEMIDDDGNVTASVPYSIITAVDDSASLPLDYKLTDRREAGAESSGDRVPLVLNDWTAGRLGAQSGSIVRVAYFEPEVEKGSEVERYFDAVVTNVVPVTQPASPYSRRRAAVFEQPPTVYNDPNLTPSVPGVTDQDSISDWDLPFQLTRKIDDEDDQYWNNYRLTPKVYLPLADGQRLFGSRFGDTTGIRIDISAADSVETLRARIAELLEPLQSELGWAAIPLRSQQLAASRGTTPFDALFLSLSMFVILSAVMLIAMLFRLGIAARLREFGTMMALGWTAKRVAALVLVEGIWVTSLGILVGIFGGIAYASFVLWALRSWWVGAVTVPFLTFHWTPTSLVLGGVSSGVVAFATMLLTIRSITRRRAQSLLSGRDDEPTRAANSTTSRPRRAGSLIAIAMIVIAVVVAIVGASLSGQAAAGSFVGAGMLLLIAVLLLIHTRLSRPRFLESTTGARNASRRYSLGVIASRSASKHPLRSTLTIGLMATASFLIIAITAFRLQPDDSGTGGFELIAQTSQPIFRDISEPAVQSELLGPDSKVLTGAAIATMRIRSGQDASCNNLYQATQPTVLGVPITVAENLSQDQAFRFAAAGVGEQSPWQRLAKRAAGTATDPVPVIIDQNTAMWSLQMTSGIGEVRGFTYHDSAMTYFEVVGLLSNSVLQGKLLIGEDNFETTFPSISGYQYFMISTPDQSPTEVAQVLESRLGDFGMDVTDAKELLAGMLAVQNTYLRTFQSLGALGLLLGTIGLAIAQLRSVLERRGELAIMRAVGFTRRRLASLVLSETIVLLVVGIGCGAGCAVLAVLPYALTSGTRPPITEPILVLIGITLFGMCAAVLSLRRVMQLPLLASLKAQ